MLNFTGIFSNESEIIKVIRPMNYDRSISVTSAFSQIVKVVMKTQMLCSVEQNSTPNHYNYSFL